MKKLTLLLLALIVQRGWGVSGGRCFGGDGPIPFSEIGLGSSLGMSVVPTSKAVKNFVYWDKSERLFYQSHSGEIREIGDGGVGKETFVSQAESPLIPLSQRGLESRLTVQFPVQYLPLQKKVKNWEVVSVSPRYRPLYWDGNDLYLSGAIRKFPGTVIVDYAVHHADSKRTEFHSCPIGVRPNEEYHLGKGHRFPYLFLYRTVKVEGGTRLNTYDLQLKQMGKTYPCAVLYSGKFQEKVLGNVTDVMQFNEGRVLGVRTDHPSANFLWDAPERCQYFDIGRRQVVAPNYQLPAVVTWDEDEGLAYFNPLLRTRIPILPELKWAPLSENRVWLTPAGKFLFVYNPETQSSDSEGVLYETHLKSSVPSNDTQPIQANAHR